MKPLLGASKTLKDCNCLESVVLKACAKPLTESRLVVRDLSSLQFFKEQLNYLLEGRVNAWKIVKECIGERNTTN